LRDFAIIAGRNLRSEQKQVGETTLRSIFIPEHERIGKRVLAMAEDSLRVFTSKFGPLPFKHISIARLRSSRASGAMSLPDWKVIASAYYVDFDSPGDAQSSGDYSRAAPLSGRKSRVGCSSFNCARVVGAAVGNDPAREPVLDEAMASWSALLYFREIYGEQKAAAILEISTGSLPSIQNFWRRRHGREPAVARLIGTHFSMPRWLLPKAR